MNYKEVLNELLTELKIKEGFTLRNIRLHFGDKTYNLIISVLDFGQRIEIKRNEEEYFIYVRGINGLEVKGIIHSKNDENIIKILKRFDERVVRQILNSTNYLNKRTEGTETEAILTIIIPKRVNKIKTEQEISRQIDRILDRYNDYLSLYEDPLLSDEKYMKKAKKIMRLLRKATK